MGVRGVHRGVVRVAIIGFLRAEGDSGGRRTTVSCVRRGAGARLSCSRASGGGSISSCLRLYGRHAAAAVGRGRARAVNDRLLQADQCLGGHVTRVIDGMVHWRLCREYARPVRRKNNMVNFLLIGKFSKLARWMASVKQHNRTHLAHV